MRLQGVDEEGNKVLTLVPELREMFQTVGIDIMKTEDEMYNTFEIFDKLAEKWEGIGKLRQGQIVEAIGGKHQGAIVSAMLENWHDAEGAMDSALNSAGSASREFEKYQESMQYRIGQLQNSLEEFWMVFWNDDAIKELISTLNSLVQSLTTLVEKTGALAPVMTLVTTAFLLLNTETRTLLASKGSFEGITGEFKSMGKALDGVTSVIGGFIRGFLRMIPLVAGISAITWAISAMTEKIYEANRARETYIKNLQKEIEENKKYLDDIQSFDVDRYQSLEVKAKQGTLNLAEYEEFNNLQTQIVDRYPELIQGYDNEGKAFLKTAEQIERYNEGIEQKLANDAHNLKIASEAEYTEDGFFWWQDSDQEKLQQAQDELKKYEKSLIDLQNFTSGLEVDVSQLLSAEGQQKFKENAEAFSDDAWELYNNLKTMGTQLEGDASFKAEFSSLSNQLRNALEAGEFKEANTIYGDLVDLINEEERRLEIEIANSGTAVTEDIKKFEKLIDNAYNDIRFGEGLTVKELPVLNSIKEAMLNSLDDVDNLSVEHVNAMKDIFNDISEAVEDQEGITLENLYASENLETTIKIFEKIASAIDQNIPKAQFFNALLQDMRLSLEGTRIDDTFSMEKWQADAFENFDEAISELGELEEVMEQLGEGTELTLKQISGLIQKYPELAEHIKKEGNTLKITEQGLNALRKARRDAHVEELQKSKNALLAKQKEVNGKLLEYKKEAQAIQYLQDARNVTDYEQAYQGWLSQQIASGRFDETARKIPTRARSEAESVFRAETGIIDGDFNDAVQKQIDAIDALMGAVGGGVTNGWIDQNKEVKETTEENIYVNNKYQQEIMRINHLLDEQNRIQSKHLTWSKKYQESKLEEIRLLKLKQTWLKAEAKELKRQIDTGDYVTYGNVKPSEAVMPTGQVGVQSTGTASTSSHNKVYTGQYSNQINQAGAKHGLDPFLIASLIKQESGFNRYAHNKSSGARGIMQFMPATGKEMGLSTGNNYADFFNPDKAIDAGAKYLKRMIDAVGGDVKLGLASYNAGLGNVRKYGGVPPFKETQDYVVKVARNYSDYTGGANLYGGGVTASGGTPTLKMGARGESVKELQRAIGIAVDGIFGKDTLSAVKNFQKQMGLTADGIVGSQTWQAIKNQGTTGTSGSGGTSTNQPTLRMGAKGESVKQLQRIVGVAVDGVFGKDTLNAVKNFQKQMGLTVDGIVGSATWQALQKKSGDTTGTGGAGGTTGEIKSEEQKRTEEAYYNKLREDDAIAQLIQDTWFDIITSANDRQEELTKRLTDDIEQTNWDTDKATTGADKANFLDKNLGHLQEQYQLSQESIQNLWDSLNANRAELTEATRNRVLDEIRNEKIRQINLEREMSETMKRALQERGSDFEGQVGSEFNNLEIFINDISRKLDTLDIEEDPQKYISYLREQMTAQMQQRELLADHLTWLEQQKEVYKDQEEILFFINQEIAKYTENYKDLGDEVFGTNEKIKKAYENLADETLDLFREAINNRREAELKALDDIRKEEEKNHNERMKNWDEEINKLNEYYGKQLEELDKAEGARLYQRGLEDLQRDRKEVADQLGLYAFDTTIEGKAVRRKLEEDLRNIDEKIAEHKHQRELELQREAISNERDEQIGAIEDRKKLDQEEFDDFQERQDADRERIDKHYKEILDDDKWFAEERENIINGHMENINQKLAEYQTVLGEHTVELGKNFTENFVDKIKDARQALIDFGSVYDEFFDPNKIGVGHDPLNPTDNVRLDNIHEWYYKPRVDPIRGHYGGQEPTFTTMSNDAVKSVDATRNITVSFNIDRVENGITTAETLYKRFTDTLKRKGVRFE